MEINLKNKILIIDYIKLYKSRDLIDIECHSCKKTTKKIKSKVQAAIKNNTQIFCNKKCAGEARRTKKLFYCKNCNKDVIRNKSEVKGNVFCSSSCSASYNNKIRIRKNIEIYEQTLICSCGKTKKTYSQCCRLCYNKKVDFNTIELFLNKTFGEFKKESYNQSHVYYSQIRGKNKKYLNKVYGDKLNKECAYCKYDTYVELCHIIPISNFSDESKMSEINSLNNLVYLCPNHHKELDLGLMTEKDIYFLTKSSILK